MNITNEQRIFLLTKRQRNGKPGLWLAACLAQNWNPDDRDFRMAKLSEIVGHPLASASDIEYLDEFTKVKNALLILAGVSLQAASEGSDTAENDARILRFKIRKEIMPCLALYEDAEQYLATVLTCLLRWNKTDRPMRAPSLDDIDARPRIGTCRTGKRKGQTYEMKSQLAQALMTLTARVNEKRNAAGHTIHQMRTMADLPCHCAQCEPRKLRVVTMTPETDLEKNPW